MILGNRSIGDIVELLSDGRDLGMDLTYRYQRGSLGIAHTIGVCRQFVGSDPDGSALPVGVKDGRMASATGSRGPSGVLAEQALEP